MRSAIIILLVMASSTMGGCGLLFVPTVHDYPGVVKGVRVVDCDTNLPVPDPHISFEIAKFVNWVAFPPLVEDSEDISQVPGLKKNEDRVVLDSTCRDGTFTFDRKYMWGALQIWLPLPPVLGPAVIHEHQAVIAVEASGYRRMKFTYNPRNPPEANSRYETRREEGGHVYFDESGILTFYLKRCTPFANPKADRPRQTAPTE